MRRSPFSELNTTRRRETPLDVQILQALDPVHGFKILPTNYLPLVIPGDDLSIRERAGELARRPFGDDCPERNKDGTPYRCPHVLLRYVHFQSISPSPLRYYYRTPAGDAYLIERGHLTGTTRTPARNAHQAVADIWKAQLAFGLRTSTLRHNGWPQLLERDQMPASTKTSTHPLRLYTAQNEYLVPDDYPFSLGNDNGGFLFSREVDCGTEQLLKSHDKNTIEGKLAMWSRLHASHKPERHYGAKPGSFRLIIQTVTEGRRQSIKNQILKQLGACNWIYLGLTPNYPKLGVKPPKTDDALTQRYQRAGFPDYSLATLSEV